MIVAQDSCRSGCSVCVRAYLLSQSDIVGYTALMSHESAIWVLNFVSEIFEEFDTLCDEVRMVAAFAARREFGIHALAPCAHH